MKTTTRVLILLLSFGLFSSGISQTTQADADFKVFWEKFKAAVIKVDKNTVGSLTKYPLGMSYGIRSIKTRAEFMKRYREVFNQQTDAAKCFATKEPEKNENNSKRFTIVCPDAAGNEVVAFDFTRGKTGWRFIALDNYNE